MKLLTLAKLMTFCGLMVSSSALFSMAPTKPVIAIHTSSIGPNEDKGKIIAGALTVAPKILLNHPSMLLPWKLNAIIEQGKQIARRMQGTGNIIHALLKDYNLTENEEKAVLGIAMAPVPNPEMQNFIDLVKKQGHKVILISNRDTEDYTIFKRIMAEKNINLDELLDGLVNIPTYHKLDLGDQNYIVSDDNEFHFIAKAPMPDASFSQAMRALADKLNFGAPIWCLPEPKHAEEHAVAINNDELNIRGFASLQDLKATLETIETSASAAASAAASVATKESTADDYTDPFDDLD